MRCIAVKALAALLYISLVTGLVTFTVDDGVAPVSDAETQIGKRVTITCEIDATTLGRNDRTALQFSNGSEWQTMALSGQTLAPWNTENYTIVETSSGNFEQLTFTILAANMGDEGTYKCEIYDLTPDKVTASVETTLKIYSQTTEVIVDNNAPTIKVTADENKLIRCTANGGSQPTIALKVGTTDLVPSMTVTEMSPGVYTAQATVTFTSAHDGQQLTCSAQVKTFSEAITGSAVLKITAKPTVVCNPMTNQASFGNEAKFTCEVGGIPLPTPNEIYWAALLGSSLGGNEEMPDSGLTSTATVVGDKLQAVLTVRMMETNSPDRFTITASNAGGATSVTMEITKKSPTGDVSDGSDTDSGAETLSFGLSLVFVLMAALLL